MRENVGSSLFEVLIALLMLSLAIVGLDSMQLRLLSETIPFEFVRFADHQVDVMKDIIISAAPASFIREESKWLLETQTMLPNARATVSGTYPSYTIELMWGGALRCQDAASNNDGCIRKSVEL